jgi:hypothetical protein
VQWSCSHIECTGIDEGVTSRASCNHSQFGEPDVVADAETYPCKLCVEVTEFAAPGECRALLESDFARNVNVE